MNGVDPDVHSPVFESTRPLPGIGERQAMLYRLRKDTQAAGTEYTDTDYQNDLIRDGMSERLRNYLFAIRYRVFTLREIRQLLDTGIVTQDEIKGAYLDEGFAETQAARLASMERVVYSRRHAAEIQGFTPSRIALMYGTGLWDSIDVEARMNDLGYSDADAKALMLATESEDKARERRKWADKAVAGMYSWLEKTYKAGIQSVTAVMSLLQSVGCGKDSAELIVKTWDGEVQLSTIESGTACVKRGWASGFTSNISASETLVTLGYSLGRATQIVGLWQLCRDFSERIADASHVLSGYKSGLVSPLEAVARLTAMGYKPEYADFLIAQEQKALDMAALKAEQAQEAKDLAAAKAAEKQAAADKAKQEKADEATLKATQAKALAALAAEQRAEAKSATAAARLARQAKAAAAAAVKQLRAATPPALLEALLKTGQISAEKFTERMELMGYDLTLAQLEIVRICNEGKAACTESNGPADSLIPGSAPSGPGDAGGAQPTQ
jgi:hypothetical protein